MTEQACGTQKASGTRTDIVRESDTIWGTQATNSRNDRTRNQRKNKREEGKRSKRRENRKIISQFIKNVGYENRNPEREQLDRMAECTKGKISKSMALAKEEGKAYLITRPGHIQHERRENWN